MRIPMNRREYDEDGNLVIGMCDVCGGHVTPRTPCWAVSFPGRIGWRVLCIDCRNDLMDALKDEDAYEEDDTVRWCGPTFEADEDARQDLIDLLDENHEI